MQGYSMRRPRILWTAALILVTAALSVSLSLFSAASADDGKVRICHATESNSNEFVLIEVSTDSVPAHATHHDRRDIIPAPPTGPCPGPPPPPDVVDPICAVFICVDPI